MRGNVIIVSSLICVKINQFLNIPSTNDKPFLPKELLTTSKN